jgi:RecB family exonuclease
MLYVIENNHEGDKLEFYKKDFDPKQDCWMTYNLQTKIVLKAQSSQNLNNLKVLENSQVLEASQAFYEGSFFRIQDFWYQIFLTTIKKTTSFQGYLEQTFLGRTLVDESFLSHWIEEEIINHQESESLLRQQSPRFFVGMMALLGPLILHSQGQSHLEEFFRTHPDSSMQWEHWYRLTYKLSQVVLLEKKWFLPQWLPHLLLDYEEQGGSLFLPKKRKFFVDLGPRLKGVEAQLFKVLSRKVDIYVLEPLFANSFPHKEFLTQAYRILDSEKREPKKRAVKERRGEPQKSRQEVCQNTEENKDHTLDIQNQNQNQQIRSYSYSTEFDQIEDFFDQTEKLIVEKGVLPQDIVWLFPDTERIEPVLWLLSSQRKVPLSLQRKKKLSADPQVLEWLQKLKLASGQLSWSCLEQAEVFKELSLVQRQSLFRKISHSKEMESSYLEELKNLRVSKVPLSYSAFLEHIQSLWIYEDKQSCFDIIIKKFHNRIPSEGVLSYSRWLDLLETTVSSLDIPLEELSLKGIQVLNLSQWNLVSSPYIFLGSLVQDFLKKQESFHVSLEDLETLNRDYGYHLESSSLNEVDADLHWILQSKFKQLQLSGFHLSLEANNHALHPLLLTQWKAEPAPRFNKKEKTWEGKILEKNKLEEKNSEERILENKNIENKIQSKTSLKEEIQKEIQKEIQEEIREKRNLKEKILNEEKLEILKLETSQKEKEIFGKKIFDQGPLELGVTQFEAFSKCGFRFYLEKIMGLESPNEVDFSLDLKTQGRLNHKVMELILKHWNSDLQDPLRKKMLLSQAIKESQSLLQESLSALFWQDLSEFYDHFYEAEKKFRLKYPKVKVLGVEIPVSIYLDLKQKAFVPNKPSHHDFIFFKGVVDRIDCVDSYFIIVDYKRSTKASFSVSSWVSQVFYQLYVYGQAIQQNPPNFLKGYRWAGAEILDYTFFERTEGFLIQEIIPCYRDKPRPVRKPWVLEDIPKKLEDVKQAIIEDGLFLLKNSERFSFNKAESIKNLCEFCSWRTLCRAPHLNP